MIAAALALTLALQPAAPAAPPERLVAIRVHGNHTTPDAEVLRLAGLALEQAVTPTLPREVEQRLDASGRFRSVEVRKRYASIADLSAILLVIVVEEHAGIAIDVPSPGPMRKLRSKTMWLPILRSEDGYGFIYGARVSFVDVLGPKTRVSAPLTWGGERRASVEVERRFARGPLSRLLLSGGIAQREHPGLEVADRRTGAALRLEKAFTPWFQVAGRTAVEDIRFDVTDDRLVQLGAEAVLDTRRDPAFPRNALYAAVGVERLRFDAAADTTQWTLDGRGYVGLFRQMVLAVRARHVRPTGPLPVYEQPLLGGEGSVRGFEVGYRYGDRLLAGSAEIRIPFSTPRRLTRLGMAVFADTGTVYGSHEPIDTAEWDTGVGAGVFIQAPLVGLRIDVARGLGSGTRVHFSLGATF
jgi:outer membrane protein assembly factor BamA